MPQTTRMPCHVRGRAPACHLSTGVCVAVSQRLHRLSCPLAPLTTRVASQRRTSSHLPTSNITRRQPATAVQDPTAGLDKSLLIHPCSCQAPGRAPQPNWSPGISWRRHLPDGFGPRGLDVEFCRPVLCRKMKALDDSHRARMPPTRRLHEAR